MSPTQRSLKLMRERGYTCQITEKWNPFAKVRQDLFGFCDILCIKPGEIMAVQTTTSGHIQERLEKIKSKDQAWMWLQAGGKIQVHGWKKSGKRSEFKGKWIYHEINHPQSRPLPSRKQL